MTDTPTNGATPLGMDLKTPNPQARMLDHVHEGPYHWTFCHGPDVQEGGPILVVPKSIATRKEDAIRAAEWLLRYAGVAWKAGEQKGRAEAQRFYRVALGIEEPTRSEAARWNNPVPLKQREDDLAKDTEARALGWT